MHTQHAHAHTHQLTDQYTAIIDRSDTGVSYRPFLLKVFTSCAECQVCINNLYQLQCLHCSLPIILGQRILAQVVKLQWRTLPSPYGPPAPPHKKNLPEHVCQSCWRCSPDTEGFQDVLRISIHGYCMGLHLLHDCWGSSSVAEFFFHQCSWK